MFLARLGQLVNVKKIKDLCRTAIAEKDTAKLEQCLDELRVALRDDPLPVPVTPRGKPLILCVEDNLTYLHLRKAVLEKDGYAVLSATTTDEAMEMFRRTPVCLVLSDHMLRGSTGTQLAEEMKKIKPDVPIALYSGNPPQSLRNVDCFINKGESVATFLSLIREIVKRYCQ